MVVLKEKTEAAQKEKAVKDVVAVAEAKTAALIDQERAARLRKERRQQGGG